MHNMKRRTLGIIILTAVVVLGLGFAWQQAKRETSRKPKWEQATAEEFRRILEEDPEIYNLDNIYTRFIIRASKVGAVGVWKEALQDSEVNVRVRALRQVTPEVLSAETAIPAIEPLLEDESGRVRFEAAMALLRFGSDRGARGLVELLKEPGDASMTKIVLALVRYKRTEAIPVMRELFQKGLDQLEAGEGSPVGLIRSLSLGLGAFRDGKSAALFERYFRLRQVDGLHPLDGVVVEAAGRLGEPLLEGWLQEIFNRTEEPTVRVAAAFGLAKLGDESALTFLMDQAALLRGAPKPDAVNKGPEGGRMIPSPAFVEWSQGKPPMHVLRQAVLYLGELKAHQALPLLVELTHLENQWALGAVVKSLALLGDRRAVPVLVELTGPEHPLRYYVAKALLFFDDPEAERAVRRLYKDESELAKLRKEAQELGPAEFLRQ